MWRPSQSGALELSDATTVAWLEQSEADLPPHDDWLSVDEALQLDRLRFAKRRADWRLGRWTAKQAVALCLGIAEQPGVLPRLQILAAPSGAPEAVIDPQIAGQSADQPLPLSISLSHSCGRALCAVVRSTIALGCDVEEVAPRSDAFVADYFTPEEQAMVASASLAARPRVSTLIWSAKESALKALHAGLRLDTRSVIVSASESSCDWRPLRVRHADHSFVGWWQEADGFIRTIVSSSIAPNPPSRLRSAAQSQEIAST